MLRISTRIKSGWRPEFRAFDLPGAQEGSHIVEADLLVAPLRPRANWLGGGGSDLGQPAYFAYA
jgi:hypothetical protein